MCSAQQLNSKNNPTTVRLSLSKYLNSYDTQAAAGGFSNEIFSLVRNQRQSVIHVYE